MTNLLKTICDTKRAEVALAKSAVPLAALEAQAKQQSIRPFAKALESAAAKGFGIIAEIKKASPSAGVIREVYDPAGIAASYANAGAACLSILTDKQYFAGEAAHLVAARAACPLPALRKDFMIDTYQVTEARAWGADCILIIMAAVDDTLARELHSAAVGYGMDVLIEVHDRPELERALKLPSGLMGINNRNLSTLKVDLGTTKALAKGIPPGRTIVSESGLKTNADLHDMARVGARCFLVGESLLKQPDPGVALKQLLAI